MSDDPQPRADEKDKTREVQRALKPKGRGRLWVVLLLLVIAASAAVWWFFLRTPDEDNVVQWRTVTVERGDIIMQAIATGNLEPQRTISIGAEVSGRIETVEVDVNQTVTEGQVLARFDTESLDNSLEQARVQLNATRASQQRSQIAIADARDNEARLRTLFDQGATSARDYEVAKTTLRRAQADLTDAQAQTRLQQIRVELAQTNRDRSVITSPVNGVILKRAVEPGNTVASSLQSPELFLVAEDLARMELHVGIDEADVGLVKAGQEASFTVDAWPENTFHAAVTLVHLYPASTEGVVSYTAVLAVDNSDGLLRPGMTASATITTEKRAGVVRVPNAALRFTPPTEGAEKGALSSVFSGGPPRGMPRSRSGTASSNIVWVLRGKDPTRIPVKLGRSDGIFTEIIGDDLKEGDVVVVGVKRPGSTEKGRGNKGNTNGDDGGNTNGNTNTSTNGGNAEGMGGQGRRRKNADSAAAAPQQEGAAPPAEGQGKPPEAP